MFGDVRTGFQEKNGFFTAMIADITLRLRKYHMITLHPCPGALLRGILIFFRDVLKCIAGGGTMVFSGKNPFVR